ncbi:Carbon-nitrogen hydrolase [Penicillium malachiteum]|nr:Carbon-nitrogen hydrolase [Penicillium malachiteum]
MSSQTASIRVAVTQAEPEWLDLAAGVTKTCELIILAAQEGAKLIAFPEYWIPETRLLDVDLNVAYVKNSLRLDSPEMREIQLRAKNNNIAMSLGFAENSNNSLYISQVLIGPDGEIKNHRRKMKPTHMERTIFGDASGECFDSVSELPFARVGTLSCWEHIQPLLKYHTISQQEDIRVAAWPSLFPHTGGSDLWSMSAEGDTLMSSPGGGSSAVFGPDGRRVTEPVESTTEQIILADLDMDMIIATKLFADGTGHYSRPDLMCLNVNKRVNKMVYEDEDVVEAKDEIKGEE